MIDKQTVKHTHIHLTSNHIQISFLVILLLQRNRFFFSITNLSIQQLNTLVSSPCMMKCMNVSVYTTCTYHLQCTNKIQCLYNYPVIYELNSLLDKAAFLITSSTFNFTLSLCVTRSILETILSNICYQKYLKNHLPTSVLKFKTIFKSPYPSVYFDCTVHRIL